MKEQNLRNKPNCKLVLEGCNQNGYTADIQVKIGEKEILRTQVRIFGLLDIATDLLPKGINEAVDSVASMGLNTIGRREYTLIGSEKDDKQKESHSNQ